LFIDDVNAKDYAAAGDLKRTQSAALKFVTEAMQPGTRIGIFTVSGTVTQDFTADAAKLIEAIGNLKPHQRMSEIGLQYCPRVTPYRAYQITQLRDRQTLRIVLEESQPPPTVQKRRCVPVSCYRHRARSDKRAGGGLAERWRRVPKQKHQSCLHLNSLR
jgi:hypothetical protein